MCLTTSCSKSSAVVNSRADCPTCQWLYLESERRCTYEFLPSIHPIVSQCSEQSLHAPRNLRSSLRLRNTTLHGLYLLWPKARSSSLMLRPCDPRRLNRLLKIRNGGRSTWLPLSWSCGIGRHDVYYNLSTQWLSGQRKVQSTKSSSCRKGSAAV